MTADSNSEELAMFSRQLGQRRLEPNAGLVPHPSASSSIASRCRRNSSSSANIRLRP